MDYGPFDFLTLLGSLGLFLYGCSKKLPSKL